MSGTASKIWPSFDLTSQGFLLCSVLLRRGWCVARFHISFYFLPCFTMTLYGQQLEELIDMRKLYVHFTLGMY